MTTKDIRVSTQHTTCDVCGRNLLRGENAEKYVAGGERYWVCDLCVSRALQDGWVREGTAPTYEPDEYERDRRRSPLRSLRARLGGFRRDEGDFGFEEEVPPHQPERPPPPVRAPEVVHEPRHVHAVPTSPEHKVSSAVRAFNGSQHTRTIAGVARSLGPPAVSVRPSAYEASVVQVVAAWELCWYRYEIDLADELPNVRVAAQGSELDELEPDELQANASATEDGVLAVRG